MPGTRSGELLGLWACGFGVLRLVHLGRASPRRLSRSTFHFHCGRGKQKGNRHGFDFAIPGHFMSGWDWASRWLEEWQDLPASKRATSGLNFSEHGVPYTTPQTVHRPGPLYPAAWRVGGFPDLVLLQARWAYLCHACRMDTAEPPAGLGRLAGQDAGKGAGQHHATEVQWDTLHHVGAEEALLADRGGRPS